MDKLVESFINDPEQSEDLIENVASDIQMRVNHILSLVEKLGPHLTSSDTALRIKACTLVGKILLKLKDDYLSEKELSSLVVFLCARLQDHYTLQSPILTALTKVSCSVNLVQDDAKYIVATIFKEVHVQSCLQSERYKVYQIVSNVLQNHMSVIVNMGRDFLCSFIQAIDGEQDPRNLLVVFGLVSDLIQNGIDLTGQEEEVFEVTSCYFPIDFNPASVGKKTTITNEALVLGLRSVLASTNKFAKYCIPLLLEKMESDIESAKIDSILTLIECLPKYSKSDLEPFLSSIWSRLKQEICNAVSQDVEKNSLELLTQLVKHLSLWPTDLSSEKITDLHSFIKEVLDDCLPRLKEPIQDKLTWMSGLMLLACAKGSKLSCNLIVTATVPLFLDQAIQAKVASTAENFPSTPLKTSNFLSLIEGLVKIMSICSNFTFKQHPISPYQKDILNLFQEVLTLEFSAQTKCAAVAGVASLLSLNILKDDELHEIASCLLSLLGDRSDPKLYNEVLSAAGYFSSKHSEITKSIMLPPLYATLPAENFVTVPLKVLKNTFSSLSALATHFDLLQDIVAFLTKLMQKCKVDEAHSMFLQEVLNCLLVISKNCCSGHEYVEYLALNLVLPLMKICIETSLELSSPELCCTSCTSVDGFSVDCISLPIVKSAAVIIRCICQKQRPGKTADFIVQLITDLYLNGNIDAFGLPADGDKKLAFDPFNPHFSLLQTRSICFLTSSICVFNNKVSVHSINDFLNRLLQVCVQSPDQPTYVSAAKAFAGLINKHNKSNEDMISKARQCCKNAIQNAQEKSGTKLSALTLLIWTTKALVLCNHRQTNEIVADLLSLLSDNDIGDIAAAGFDIVLRESEEVLCSATHAMIRIMYRQRFFLLVLPKLVAGFHAACKEEEMEDLNEDGSVMLKTHQKVKANHLTALSYLLLHLPKQVLLQEFPNLMPLLVQSMRSDDPHLLLSVLSALYYLLQDASNLMESHIDSLLEDFLRLSRFQKDLKVRLKAVQCIGASTLLPTPVILPLQNKVVRQLASALDDRKRDVRTEASQARSEWFLVGV